MFIKIYDETSWRDVVNKFDRYDFYHTWDYHALAQECHDEVPVLFFYGCEEGAFAFPLIEREIKSNVFDYTSVYGYAGPLCRGNDAWVTYIWSRFLSYLSEYDVPSIFSRIDTLTCPPVLFPNASNGKTVYVDLTTPEEIQVKEYRSSLRYDLKKLSAMGASCFHTKDPIYIDKFIEIYNTTMQSLKASDSYLFPYIYYERLLSSKDFDCRMYFCKFQGRLISASIFVFCCDIVQYHLSGTLNEYYRIAPSKLIIDHVRQEARRDGMRVLHLGGGVGAEDDSLFKFKTGFSKHTLDFYQIRQIVNANICSELCEELLGEPLNSSSLNNQSFFPPYRLRGLVSAKVDTAAKRCMAIFGACGHGKVVADVARACGWSDILFFDDYLVGYDINVGSEICGNSAGLVDRIGDFDGVMVAIGDCDVRLKKQLQFIKAGGIMTTLIHPNAYVASSSVIGLGTVIMAGAVVQPGVYIGDCCIVNTCASLDHDCYLGDGVHISPGVRLSGNVTINSLAWIGVGAVVRQGLEIGSSTIVGAGAVVVSDIVDRVTVVGCPARPLVKSRRT